MRLIPAWALLCPNEERCYFPPSGARNKSVPPSLQGATVAATNESFLFSRPVPHRARLMGRFCFHRPEPSPSSLPPTHSLQDGLRTLKARNSVTSPRVAALLFSKKRIITFQAPGLFAAAAGCHGAGRYLLSQTEEL